MGQYMSRAEYIKKTVLDKPAPESTGSGGGGGASAQAKKGEGMEDKEDKENEKLQGEITEAKEENTKALKRLDSYQEMSKK